MSAAASATQPTDAFAVIAEPKYSRTGKDARHGFFNIVRKLNLTPPPPTRESWLYPYRAGLNWVGRGPVSAAAAATQPTAASDVFAVIADLP